MGAIVLADCLHRPVKTGGMFERRLNDVVRPSSMGTSEQGRGVLAMGFANDLNEISGFIGEPARDGTARVVRLRER